MPGGGASSQRVLILAPHGRDAKIASDLLIEAGWHTLICVDVTHLREELEKGAALAVLTEEAVADADLSDLSTWVSDQPAWSDMPIVLLTGRGDSPERVEQARRYQQVLGNVTYLERPFHPTTLISVARSALRSRRRQYEARASLERHILLAREVQHRTKNLLAVIQSIASATLPASPAKEEYFARLHALGRAQDLLLEHDGKGASIRDLVTKALSSLGERVIIEGPDIFLTANMAQGLALILQELATNAAKHGALSVPTGIATVQWSQKEGSPASLIFRWRERGGPPASAPMRKGFGTRLLEVAVASADAPPLFEYSAEGFGYELTADLESQT